jgi:GAF domain-containing protein
MTPAFDRSDTIGQKPGQDHDGLPVTADHLQSLLMGNETVREFLDDLTSHVASRAGWHCGVTVLERSGMVYTAAASDDVGLILERFQNDTQTGPSPDSMVSGQGVDGADLAHESRWGGFPALAVSQGVQSSFSSPLAGRDRCLGALSIYSDAVTQPDSALREEAQRLAGYAAGAADLVLRQAERVELIANLQTALRTRSRVDQAVGILMAEQHCDSETAIGLLRTASQARNVKLKEVADAIVARFEAKLPTESAS